jgi:oligopeptide transport system substrate-binding protein
MWARTLGVRCRVEGKEAKTFREDKKNVNYVVCRASWFGDYQDPTTFLEMFMTGNGNNDSGYSDPKYDGMLAAAEEIADPGMRLERLAEAERYLVNEGLPLLPLYQYVNVFAFDPDRVKNLYLTPRMMTMLKQVEVVR